MTNPSHHSSDPILAIIASGREITDGDVELVWGDFIDGRCSWQQTSARAKALVETVNVPSHLANAALTDLVHLWLPGADRDPASHRAKREQWRMQAEKYNADPLEWDRPFYQDMLRRRASAHGLASARQLGTSLVRGGLMRELDAAAVLDEVDMTARPPGCCSEMRPGQ